MTANEPAAAGAYATPHAPANPNPQPSYKPAPLGSTYLCLLPPAMPITIAVNLDAGTYANGHPVAKTLMHAGPKPREEDWNE